MAEEQQKLQSLSETLQKFQEGRNTPYCTTCGINRVTDLQTTVEARQKLESQQQENKAVQKEFSGLTEDAKIYKLVGPILLKQERSEAVSAVDGRLEFIGKEISRTEGRIKELQENSEKRRIELMQLQQKMQMAAQEQAGA